MEKLDLLDKQCFKKFFLNVLWHMIKKLMFSNRVVVILKTIVYRMSMFKQLLKADLIILVLRVINDIEHI